MRLLLALNRLRSTRKSGFGGIQIRRAVVLSFAARIVNSTITLISGIVIARLLTPEETGVFALGFTLILFLQIISESGFNNYLVQEKDLTHEKIRATFTITLFLAWSAGGLLVLASGPASAFYKAPTLAHVMSVLAISLFMLPFGLTVLGFLRREFRFAELYAIGAARGAAAAVVSVSLAMMGFGAVSMAWGAAAGAALVTIYACLSRPKCAVMKPTLRNWSPVLAFGGLSTFASIIIQLTESAMQLLTGRMLGLYSLGLFNRAYYLAIHVRANVLGSVSNEERGGHWAWSPPPVGIVTLIRCAKSIPGRGPKKRGPWTAVVAHRPGAGDEPAMSGFPNNAATRTAGLSAVPSLLAATLLHPKSHTGDDHFDP